MSTPALPFIGIRCPCHRFDQHAPPMLAGRWFFCIYSNPLDLGAGLIVGL